MYWILIPKKHRKRCLFKKSCSHYVYDITREKGFFEGIKALRFRFANCKPNYSIVEGKNEKLLVTENQHVFTESEISEWILNDNTR